MVTPQLLIDLLLILTIAWVMGGLFSRFGLPIMLGQLLAGVLLGPPLLGLVSCSPAIVLIAELGIFFLMFYSGMEMDPKELLEHIWPSLAVALGGFVLPFAVGFLTARAFGGTLYQSLFVGLGISITAIAVQSAILYSMRINESELGHIIIGAAIVDDILCLMSLSVLLGLAKTGTVQFIDLSIVILKVIAFFGLTILLGLFVLPKMTAKLHDREGKAFTFAIVSALTMAYLAELAGLHLIIGAFLAGLFVRKEIMDFWDWRFISFALTLTLVAILGKLIGCGLGLAIFRRNPWECTVVGFGMSGRGAVELVVAAVVLRLGDKLMSTQMITEPLLTEAQFSGLVLMAFITTLIAPLSLRWAVVRTCLPDEKAAFCRLWKQERDRER